VSWTLTRREAPGGSQAYRLAKTQALHLYSTELDLRNAQLDDLLSSTGIGPRVMLAVASQQDVLLPKDGNVARISRFGRRLYPSCYCREKTAASPLCLDRSQDDDMFLVGYSDDSIALFSSLYSRPLMAWYPVLDSSKHKAHPALGGFIQVKLVSSCPGVFAALHRTGTLLLFDLFRSATDAVKVVPGPVETPSGDVVLSLGVTVIATPTGVDVFALDGSGHISRASYASGRSTRDSSELLKIVSGG